MLARLDGLTLGGYLDDPAHTDTDGVEWVLRELNGWYGSPAPEVEREKRPSGHGTFRRVAYRGDRILSLEGTLTAPSPALCRAAQRRLSAVCGNEERLYTLEVEDELGTFVAEVELNGAILQDWRDGLSYSVEFSVPLAAPDPRLYLREWVSPSTPLTEPGAGGIDTNAAAGAGIVTAAPGIITGTAGRPGVVELENPGTAAVGPVFEIRGGLSDPLGVVEVETGAQLTYGADLAPGDVLWINCDDQPQRPPGAPGVLPPHGVLLNGTTVTRRYLAVWGEWPVLPAGARGRKYLLLGANAGGSPTLVAHARPAWR